MVWFPPVSAAPRQRRQGPYFQRIRGLRPLRPFRPSPSVPGIGRQQGGMNLPALRRPAATRGDEAGLVPQHAGATQAGDHALGAGGIDGAAERMAPDILAAHLGWTTLLQ